MQRNKKTPVSQVILKSFYFFMDTYHSSSPQEREDETNSVGRKRTALSLQLTHLCPAELIRWQNLSCAVFHTPNFLFYASFDALNEKHRYTRNNNGCDEVHGHSLRCSKEVNYPIFHKYHLSPTMSVKQT